MQILEGGLDLPDVRELLSDHLADMRGTSPEESVHALDLESLRGPGISFLSARSDDGELLGVGALSLPGGVAAPAGNPAGWAEVKSMRTAPAARGRGVAAEVLMRIIELARERGCGALMLETGTAPAFAAAHRLYERHGFAQRGAFGSYVEDPHSRFYELIL